MASIRVTTTTHDLERDLKRITVQGSAKLAKAVRKSAEKGNRTAKAFAKESAGAHGKHYSKAFSAEALTPMSWEYGPDSSLPQGDMSFEYGSRQQKPHLDLNRSADIIGPEFADAVGDVIDGLFW